MKTLGSETPSVRSSRKQILTPSSSVISASDDDSSSSSSSGSCEAAGWDSFFELEEVEEVSKQEKSVRHRVEETYAEVETSNPSTLGKSYSLPCALSA